MYQELIMRLPYTIKLSFFSKFSHFHFKVFILTYWYILLRNIQQVRQNIH